MKSSVILFLLLLVSFLLTYLVRFFALRLNVLDVPNERSSHKYPTPRGGGLAIVVCWYIGLIFLYVNNQIDENLFFALLSGIILAVISLIDDIISLKPVFRLAGQFLSAGLAVYFLKGLRFFNISGWIIDSELILIPLIIIAIVWFINLFNFLDGIDGYASVEAISIAIVLFIFTGNFLSLLLIACVSGFLIWNWPKAKIFMGDVGSTQLGFILIIVGIYLNNENKFSFLLWILLSSPFWFDATLTLFRRFRNKEKLSQAHRKHIYQRIVRYGFSHQQTNMALIGLNIFITGVILLIYKFDILTLPLFFSVIGLLFYINYQVDKRVRFK
jgi:Fuc2NAc and GlcNAc transferase